jgi:DNA-binding response OmpR family regulator
MKGTLLIVDDDSAIRQTVGRLMENEGYRAVQASDAEEALVILRKEKPDLMILDVRMPGLDGFELCRKLRLDPAWKSLPVIFLTSKEEETSKVLGLELGGDDYITKPFGSLELLARVKTALRRRNKDDAEELLEGGALKIDLLRRQVTLSKKRLELPGKEFDLLCALLRRKGRVLSRRHLMESVWGADDELSTRTVDTHVYRLRRHLGPHGACVKSVENLGYKWVDL